MTGQVGAARLLGVSADELWDAELHILAVEGMGREIIDTDIQHIAPQLRFVSAAGNDRLVISKEGTANAQQLQTMRVLTPQSAELLAAILHPVA